MTEFTSALFSVIVLFYTAGIILSVPDSVLLFCLKQASSIIHAIKQSFNVLPATSYMEANGTISGLWVRNRERVTWLVQGQLASSRSGSYCRKPRPCPVPLPVPHPPWVTATIGTVTSLYHSLVLRYFRLGILHIHPVIIISGEKVMSYLFLEN